MAPKLRRISLAIFITIQLVAISSTASTPKEEDSPIVEILQGQIQGLIRDTPEGGQYYAFLGIPFGQAPAGELRLKAPVAADSWNGVFAAKTDPPSCIQPALAIPVPASGEEDCLYLSVFTPSLPTNETSPSLPVHVFIHGGGYFGGDIDSRHYGPERYMNANTILVLMNYRLGALGFLSTGDAAASGNYGLLDQNLALKWVQANIAFFGGNPGDVTLSGQSAGSSSVISHILSPMSAGLFHRAIAESGSALCPWAMEEHPLYFAQALGKHFNCSTSDTTELVECLREQDAGQIQAKSVEVMLANLTLSYVPVVENPDTGLFLTEDPTTLLEEGRFNKVPLLMGFNRDEGVLIYEWIFYLCDDINDVFFDDLMPLLLEVLTDYRQNLRNVSYAIKDQYYTGLDVNNRTAVDTTNIDVISDMFMKSWSVKTVELISSHDVPVYMYAFNYVSSTASTKFTGGPDVSHGTELKYLFNSTILSKKDSTWGGPFFELWANFITQENPTPSGTFQWIQTPPGQSTYADINEEFTMIDVYDPDDMQFWFEEVPAIVNG